MDQGVNMAPIPYRVGAFRRRIAWVFGLQFLAVCIICVMGIYDVAPAPAVITVIVLTTMLGWLAARRQWRPVRSLARLVAGWDGGQQPDPDAQQLHKLSAHADADVASLARGLHGFAIRLAGFNQRERNFTRDASHELRSPLTVIKMSVDMLADEEGMSEFGLRSVQRIRRATREMEILVEAMLILAREPDGAIDSEHFVVNEVLQRELQSARELLVGRPIQLELEEPAQFALEGSARAFSVLCWQLIRNACQQTEQGLVRVTVMPGVLSVSNHATDTPAADAATRPPRLQCADRHGFELAIAQRISDRFGWPLELQTRPGHENIARIRFPSPLPAVERGARGEE